MPGLTAVGRGAGPENCLLMRRFIHRTIFAVPALASATLALALQVASPIVAAVHHAEHGVGGQAEYDCNGGGSARTCAADSTRLDVPSLAHTDDTGCALCSAAANAKPFVPQRSVTGDDFLEANRRFHDTTYGPRALATLSLAAPRAPPVA